MSRVIHFLLFAVGTEEPPFSFSCTYFETLGVASTRFSIYTSFCFVLVPTFVVPAFYTFVFRLFAIHIVSIRTLLSSLITFALLSAQHYLLRRIYSSHFRITFSLQLTAHHLQAIHSLHLQSLHVPMACTCISYCQNAWQIGLCAQSHRCHKRSKDSSVARANRDDCQQDTRLLTLN